MSPGPSIFVRLKSENGTLISYYARPRSFTMGSVNSTSAVWMKVFSDYRVPNLISSYKQNGLNPLGELTPLQNNTRYISNYQEFSKFLNLGAHNELFG